LRGGGGGEGSVRVVPIHAGGGVGLKLHHTAGHVGIDIQPGSETPGMVRR
jgi:hypothetical protein